MNNYILALAILAVSVLLFLGCCMKNKEKFEDYPFVASEQPDEVIQRIFLDVPYGDASVYIKGKSLKVIGNLPMPDGGDYKTTSKKYSLYKKDKSIGDLKRYSDGYFYLIVNLEEKINPQELSLHFN